MVTLQVGGKIFLRLQLVNLPGDMPFDNTPEHTVYIIYHAPVLL